MARYGGAAASAALGAAFAAIAFVAEGGGEIAPNTGVEIALIVAGGVGVAAAVVAGPRRPLYGATAVAAFAALAALTALSVTWSIVPDVSWLEASRTLAYLAVFAGAIAAARLRPTAAPVLLRALVIAGVVVVGYALTARISPGALAGSEIYPRIGEPYGYWNAVGTTAAIAIPAALWLGARRSGHQPANALAYPALGVLFVGLLLTASRGAIVAGAVVLALWFAFVPLRLRSLVALGIPALGAAPVAIWALSQDAFAAGRVPETVRESVSAELGLLLALMAVVLTLAGLAVGYRSALRALSFRWRRRAGLALAAAGCAVLVFGFAAVALSDRGVSGTVSAEVDELTAEQADVPAGAARLTAASSSRGRYWREANKIFKQEPLAGTGAGTFGTARLHYRKDALISKHAHGYVAQTGADLGLLGLVAMLLLAVAWLVAAARTTGVRLRRGPRRALAGPGSEANGDPGWSADRVALCALALVAIAFSIHSVVDWTWFVPAPAVMALAVAGFVAGRGPPVPGGMGGAEPAVTTASAACARPGAALPAAVRAAGPVRLALAVAVVLTALLASWAVWQPARADNSLQRAAELADERRFDAAIDAADEAADRNPVSAAPLLLKARLQRESGRPAAAAATLSQAIADYPANPEPWLRLGQLEFARGRTKEAQEVLRGAIYLDPRSRVVRRIVTDVQRVLHAPQQPAPASPVSTPRRSTPPPPR